MQRTLEELERLFDELKSDQRVQVGFKGDTLFDRADAVFPIDFKVIAIDYSLFLKVEGIRAPLHIDPDCVVEMTYEDGQATIWLGACGPGKGSGCSLIFFDYPTANSPMFRISMEIL